jgi:DNA-binding CsgD family transcriptional regulator
MPFKPSTGTATQDIVRACKQGLDSVTLRNQVIARFRRAVPIDSFWFATADPVTLLFTGSVVEGIPEHATPLFVHNEFMQDDVNKWRELAASPVSVNSLYFATEGQPMRSARYRDICAPLGFGDELRAALRSGASCWGFICLHREHKSKAFGRSDLALLAGISSHVADGLRTAMLLDHAEQGHLDSPGLLVLASDGSAIATTAAGERWLAEISDQPPRRELPQLVQGLVTRLSAQESGQVGVDVIPRARVQTRAGQWLIVHASRLLGRGQQETAIIFEPAPPAEIAPLLLQAYGLTRREGEIAQLVIRGLGTAAIATKLTISDYTVQQHLKAVFHKVGVGSRRELVGQVFARRHPAKITPLTN